MFNSWLYYYKKSGAWNKDKDYCLNVFFLNYYYYL